MIVVIIGIMFLSLAPAFILQNLIDNIFNNSGIIPNDYLLKKLLLFAVAYLFSLVFIEIFELFKQISLTTIGENLMLDIRTTLAKKLKNINALYFFQVDSGQITSIFINDVYDINTIFTDGLLSMIIHLLKIIGITISMFYFRIYLV